MAKIPWGWIVIAFVIGAVPGFFIGNYNVSHADIISKIDSSTQQTDKSIEAHTAGLSTEIKDTKTAVENLKPSLGNIESNVNEIQNKTNNISTTLQEYNTQVFFVATAWISLSAVIVSLAFPFTFRLLGFKQEFKLEGVGLIVIGLLAGIVFTLILHFAFHLF